MKCFVPPRFCSLQKAGPRPAGSFPPAREAAARGPAPLMRAGPRLLQSRFVAPESAIEANVEQSL